MLRKNGVVIYPTDTVYAIGCDMMSKEAVERLCRIRHLDPQKAMLTLICKDLSQVAEYAAQIDTPVFKLMRRNLPGPFTFILPAGSKTPKLFINRKKTIGVRIPDNAILMALVEELGGPFSPHRSKPMTTWWSTSPIPKTCTTNTKTWWMQSLTAVRAASYLPVS